MQIPSIRPWELLWAAILALFGYLCISGPGLVMSFWIVLLWYSLIRSPGRFELTLLSGMGLIGGFALLPNENWDQANRIALILFALLGIAPLAHLASTVIAEYKRKTLE